VTIPKTLFEKVWDAHVVERLDGGPDLLYVDLHLVHEVTSPQAFAGLRARGLPVRRPDLTLATIDHNVPTTDRDRPWTDHLARRQVDALVANCQATGVPLFGLEDARQGIVHVVGPEQGLTQPGATIVCGDSHTSTHGAFGALAFGIGTSEVEHVLATQTLPQRRPKTFELRLEGTHLGPDVTTKDLILAVIAQIGVSGGRGHVIEFRGSLVNGASMEGRMTICNMAIEAGARAGMIASDDTTLAYLEGRPFAPRGAAWGEAASSWRELATDDGARFDRTVTVDATTLEPQVTWGTTPAQAISLRTPIPDPEALSDPSARERARAALRYMDLAPGTRPADVPVQRVFVGSCTNGRLEDLRAVAKVLEGRHVAPHVEMLVVPGSGLVKRAAEAEGLHRIFEAAGAQWRDPGCSMCLGMNPDVLAPGQRCASTSNRNFEGRQGNGGRTHLVSPLTAAATAVAGVFASPGEL